MEVSSLGGVIRGDGRAVGSVTKPANLWSFVGETGSILK